MTTTHRLAIGIATLVLSTVPVLSSTATAAAVTCQGAAATIVASGFTVDGTTGDDVIVADHTVAVSALAGNDKICIVDGSVDGGDGTDSLEVRGTDGAEHLDVTGIEAYDVTLGASYDTVELRGSVGTGVIDGGTGGGEMTAYGRDTVNVDLKKARVDIDGGSVRAIGFTNVNAAAYRVRVAGDRNDNLILVVRTSCEITVKGGAGRDDMRFVHGNSDARGYGDCGSARPLMNGQRGDDFMLGWRRDDILIGGPGDDVAKGGKGVNTCQAEQTTHCEV